MSPGTTWSGYLPWVSTVEACRREFTAVARSFWLIPELIPQPSRDDVSLLYCFSRRLDDAVDEAPSPDAARAALGAFRDEVEGRAPPRPLIAAFLAGATRSGLPLECTRHLFDGMEFDLAGGTIEDDGDLLRYSYRVSSAVGLMLAPLLGIRGEEAERRVVDLGIGLQVSNVLLGVASDAARGRVYLPRSRLAAAGLDPPSVLREPGSPRLRAVLEDLADLADAYYASAEAGAATVPLRYRHGILLLGRAYGELGRRAASGEPPLVTPGQLPRAVRVLRLAQLAASALHPRTMGISVRPTHDAALHGALAGWRGTHAAL